METKKNLQYYTLTFHELWAMFSDITRDDEIMQQFSSFCTQILLINQDCISNCVVNLSYF